MHIYVVQGVIYFLLMASCYGSMDIKKLSIEQKVGQLLVAHFHGTEANPSAQLLVQQVGVGGIIYYNWSNGLNSPIQVHDLSLRLQKLAKDQSIPIPLFIMLDQEGGRVARLTHGFSTFPGNQEVGRANEPGYAEKIAFSIASELMSVGINMNLAPVIDIVDSAKQSYISTRSFGDSPEIVISFAQRAMSGYRRGGIIGTLKHFPGHGAVEVDSHSDLPVLTKSKLELERWEFLPFKTLARDADVIMTGHILVPEIDPKNCATLSKDILDILRNEMGFSGLIISDSLVMEGLLKNCASIDEAAIKAFNAGCDLILLGGKQLVGNKGDFELSEIDIQRIHRSLVNAVNDGVICKERLDESVAHILRIKEKYGLFEGEVR